MTTPFLRSTRRGWMIFRDAPAGGPAGGGAANPPQSLEERLTKATADLSTAQAEVQRLTGELAAVNGNVTKITGERENLQTQFNAATTTATQAQTDLATARGEVSRLTAELNTAKADLARATGNITRLESLCGLRGINPNEAVVVPPGDGTTGALETAEDWNRKLAAAGSVEAKEQILKDFEAAVKAGKVKKSPQANPLGG